MGEVLGAGAQAGLFGYGCMAGAAQKARASPGRGGVWLALGRADFPSAHP